METTLVEFLTLQASMVRSSISRRIVLELQLSISAASEIDRSFFSIVRSYHLCSGLPVHLSIAEIRKNFELKFTWRFWINFS